MAKKIAFNLKTNPDDFEAVQLLGCGGFGQVFEIVHTPTNKHYAGKLISDIDEQSMKDINKEVEIMKVIDSPNAVKFYGIIKFPKSNPHYMIIMDYCDRGSIRDIMDYNDIILNEDQISFVLHDLLCALSALHTKYKIIHRDIKAANILMSSDYSIKITDFGVSRKLENTVHTISSIGTPYWMAPEVVLSEKYSFPVDIWSVGATAIELAEGAPPYFEFPPTRAMNEIVGNGFPGFRNNSQISAELKDFIYKCMAYKSEARPTADQLLTHPFIRKCEKLNRKDVFEDILKMKINFTDLVCDEDIEYIKQIIDFEIKPEYNERTNKSQSKKTMDTFVKKAAPGATINTVYIKDPNTPTLK